MASPTKFVKILSDGTVNIESPNSQFLSIVSSWGYYNKSRPTQNNVPLSLGRDFDTQTEWIYGLPDPWRVRPRSLTYSTGVKKPESIELDYDKQHWLLKIQLDYQSGANLPKDKYFQWFNTDSEQKRRMVKELTSALADDRSHTNFHGMNNRRNYLTNERMSEGLPKFAQLVTGRYIGKPVMENGKPIERGLAPDGVCSGFECIKATSDLWQYSPSNPDHKHLFDLPAITGRKIAVDKGGLRIVRDDLLTPYPQFGDKLVFPAWLLDDTIMWIPKSQTRATSLSPLTKIWVR